VKNILKTAHKQIEQSVLLVPAGKEDQDGSLVDASEIYKSVSAKKFPDKFLMSKNGPIF
jgi:hypothetical protein